MKKLTVILMAICFAAPAYEAQAWMLPPFKTDVAGVVYRVESYVNKITEQVKDKLEQVGAVQKIKAYGEGAKEAAEYAKKVKKEADEKIAQAKSGISFVKGLNKKTLLSLGMSQAMKEISKLEQQKAEALDKSGQEAANITKEYTAKTNEIDENINKINQDTIKNPEKARSNESKISALMQKKAKLVGEMNEKRKTVREKLDKFLAGIAEKINSLKGTINNALDKLAKLNPFGKNYDSTEDLKGMVQSLSPAANTEMSSDIVLSYNALYKQNHFKDMVTAANRVMLIRGDLDESDKEAEASREDAEDLETLGAANAAALIELKKQNILALIDYTELMLQDLKLKISRDLQSRGVQKIDAQTAISDFNFDNYKFVWEEGKSTFQFTPEKTYKSGEAIPKEIGAASAKAVEDGFKAIEDYAREAAQAAAVGAEDEAAQPEEAKSASAENSDKGGKQ